MLTAAVLAPVPLDYLETIKVQRGKYLYINGYIMQTGEENDLGNPAVNLEPLRNKMLSLAETEKDIYIVLNTPGGKLGRDYMRFKRAMDSLKNSNHRIICIIDGQASSLGAIIYSNCTDRYATRGGTLMAHPVTGESNVTRFSSTTLRLLLNEFLRTDATHWNKLRGMFQDDEFFTEIFLEEKDVTVEFLNENYPNVVHQIVTLKEAH
jgi:hypothetical protein